MDKLQKIAWALVCALVMLFSYTPAASAGDPEQAEIAHLESQVGQVIAQQQQLRADFDKYPPAEYARLTVELRFKQKKLQDQLDELRANVTGLNTEIGFDPAHPEAETRIDRMETAQRKQGEDLAATDTEIGFDPAHPEADSRIDKVEGATSGNTTDISVIQAEIGLDPEHPDAPTRLDQIEDGSKKDKANALVRRPKFLFGCGGYGLVINPHRMYGGPLCSIGGQFSFGSALNWKVRGEGLLGGIYPDNDFIGGVRVTGGYEFGNGVFVGPSAFVLIAPGTGVPGERDVYVGGAGTFGYQKVIGKDNTKWRPSVGLRVDVGVADVVYTRGAAMYFSGGFEARF